MNDGSTRTITEVDELLPGMVVRRFNDDGTLQPFSDEVIVRIINVLNIRLARPYLYASESGSPLMWAEVYDVSFHSLSQHYQLVLDSRGKPFIFKH